MFLVFYQVTVVCNGSKNRYGAEPDQPILFSIYFNIGIRGMYGWSMLKRAMTYYMVRGKIRRGRLRKDGRTVSKCQGTIRVNCSRLGIGTWLRSLEGSSFGGAKSLNSS